MNVGRWPRLISLVALGACSAARSQDPPSYLTSARFRRAALEASLVNPSNDYSRLRLQRYARPDASRADDWDRLPEWNPQVATIDLAAVERTGGVPMDPSPSDVGRPLTISAEAHHGSPEALRALGAEAFFRYPVQLLPSARVALRSRESLEKYGLWSDPRHGVGGLVHVERTPGPAVFAVTCATCHARVDSIDGGRSIVVGAGNDRLDLGRMFVDSSAIDLDASRARNLLLWGPGRMDVTTTRGDEPMRIPDLRPIQFLSHLHHDATVAVRDVNTLAIRIETLIIVSSNETSRPPREVALGLANYLWALGDVLPMREAATDSELRGRSIFNDRCASCHAPPSFSGRPVSLGKIGTESTVGRSRDRGTGFYRVPSLRGVATRGALLHDGTLSTIEALFDPARRKPDYTNARHGAREVQGHVYGLDLSEPARSDLVSYLRTL